ncbi:MAG: hypothetical protein ACOY3L_02980 [Pseudomonadota bacterium]
MADGIFHGVFFVAELLFPRVVFVKPQASRSLGFEPKNPRDNQATGGVAKKRREQAAVAKEKGAAPGRPCGA